MKFNEDTRVKIPSILHLTRLGYISSIFKRYFLGWKYKYLQRYFHSIYKNINNSKNLKDDEVLRVYDDISLLLENDDLGKSFLW